MKLKCLNQVFALLMLNTAFFILLANKRNLFSWGQFSRMLLCTGDHVLPVV